MHMDGSPYPTIAQYVLGATLLYEPDDLSEKTLKHGDAYNDKKL